ncbi:extracellular solute-binding protein [Patescibacteria group bacterium]|nr:extracellular solute-binding protein [Patescibacteria group bacterium]
MSDKSLPKPVLPRDPRADVNHAGVDRVGVGHTNIGPDQSQMPPSARVQAPIKSPTPGSAKPVQSVKPAQPAQLAQKPLTAGPPPATGPSLTVGPPPGADIIPPSLPGDFSGKSPQPHPLQPPQPPQPPPGVIPQPPPGAIPQPPPGTTLQPPTQAQGERKQNSFLAESPNVGHETNEKMKPAFANVKASPFKYLPYLIGGLVLIGIVGFVINKVLGNKTNSIAPAAPEQQPAAKKSVPAEQTSLTYWGLWEPDNTVTAVLEKFEAINPGVKVNYVMQSHKDYRERLQTAVSSGNGPDVFRYHASWAPMFKEELSPMPQSIMTAAEYQQTFYQVAAKQLNVNGQIVGVPLMYEGLGLYYNKEMLTAANSEPPSTWA